MNKKHIVILLSVVFLLLLACSSSGPDSSQVEATKMAIGIQQTQNAFIQMTLQAATDSNEQDFMEHTATVDLPETQATQEKIETQQIVVEPTNEPLIEASPTEEPTGNQLDKIAGLVRAEDADYFVVEDVDQIWNKKDEYWFKVAAEEAGDYVLSATVYWTAPADMGDPARNGCGFVYGMSDPKHFHVTVVSPDQKVHTYRKRSAEEIEMKGGEVPGGGLGVSTGQAQLMITVENKTMTAYVNGTQIVMFNDPYIDYGQLGLAIDSATYSGFSCSFKDIEIWILK